MGIIKEPAGVDLNLGPMTLTDKDRQAVKDIIARYKSTGEIPKPGREPKSTKRKKLTISTEKKHALARPKAPNKKLSNPQSSK